MDFARVQILSLSLLLAGGTEAFAKLTDGSTPSYNHQYGPQTMNAPMGYMPQGNIDPYYAMNYQRSIDPTMSMWSSVPQSWNTVRDSTQQTLQAYGSNGGFWRGLWNSISSGLTNTFSRMFDYYLTRALGGASLGQRLGQFDPSRMTNQAMARVNPGGIPQQCTNCSRQPFTQNQNNLRPVFDKAPSGTYPGTQPRAP